MGDTKPVLEYEAIAPPPVYHKGTLTYTTLGLIVLFFFLLWGDFCFTLMEQITPSIVPLQLKGMGASNLTIGLLLSTLPQCFGLVTSPVVAFRSDRLRTRFGRRRPILFVVTPLVTLFLVLIAYAPELGRWAVQHVLFQRFGFSPASASILVLAIFLVLFQLFNTCMSPIYYYLFVDVVPDRVLGRFMACFRIIGMLAGYLFNAHIYGHAMTHTRQIYIGAAVFYFIGFMSMCLMVREGEYPPPQNQHRMGLIEAIRLYFRECFSNRHYLLYYARNASSVIAGLCSIYTIFLLRDSLGISLDFIGKVAAWAHLVAAGLLIPMGFVTDWLNPFRATLIATLLFLPFNGLNFLFLYDESSYVRLTLLHLVITSLLNASDLPLAAMVPPRERYGQFSSAGGMITAFVVIGLSPVAAWYTDWMTAKGTIVANYRYGYLWALSWQFVSTVLFIFFYRSWRKHGGPNNYQPPG